MSAAMTHLPWCVDHYYGDELDWCQSRRVEVEGYVAYMTDAPVGENGERLHRITLENPEEHGGDDVGLSGPDLYRFMDEVKELCRECWRAVTPPAETRQPAGR